MHIGIDISQVIYTGTGVARFTHQLVNALLDTETPHTITFFFSSFKHPLPKDLEIRIKKSKHHLIRWSIPPRALSRLWNDRVLGRFTPIPAVFDVFISSDWTQPPPHIATKRVTVLHDLVFRQHPETVDALILSTQTKRLARVFDECSLIICDSQSTATDFAHLYPGFSGNVSVHYPGFTPLSLPPDTHVFPYAFTPKEYFFAVGKIEPRKNLIRLIEAFLALIKQPRFAHLHLVLAGPRGWEIEAETLRHAQVHLLGTVSDEHLALLYNHALAFVYPSLYEGFGIPPLEAMSLSCPTITSNAASLSEIATPESTLFVTPTETAEITQAMAKLATNKPLRNKLILAGKQNISRFQWDRYVADMLKSIEQLTHA